MKRKTAGFSLIEAITVMAMLAITLTLGLSNFGGSLRRNRTQATMHLLSADMAMARNTAIMRGMAVVVCPRTAHGGCAGDSDWSRGWIVFADGDGNRRPEPDQIVLRSEEAPAAGDGSMRVVSSRPLLRYQQDGRSANSNLTVHVCVDGRISGQVIVNNLGRVRTSTRKAASPCPR